MKKSGNSSCPLGAIDRKQNTTARRSKNTTEGPLKLQKNMQSGELRGSPDCCSRPGPAARIFYSSDFHTRRHVLLFAKRQPFYWPTTTSTPQATTFPMSNKHSQDPQDSQSDIIWSRTEFFEGLRGSFWATSDTDKESDIRALQLIAPASRTKETNRLRGPVARAFSTPYQHHHSIGPLWGASRLFSATSTTKRVQNQLGGAPVWPIH